MIGAALKRREDPPLVRGAGRYVDDLVLPHMAFLTILRSPHASARIAGVDTTRAAKLPGVLAIFTARDLEGHVDAEPAIGFPPMARRPPRPLLARDFVRYVGEPVAAVVSVDRYVGADAAPASLRASGSRSQRSVSSCLISAAASVARSVSMPTRRSARSRR